MKVLRPEVAAHIRNACDRAGKSVPEAERQAGFSPSITARWENMAGEEFNLLSKFSNMADFLGVTLDELVTGKRAPSAKESRTKTTSAAEREGITAALIEKMAAGSLKWQELPLYQKTVWLPNGVPVSDGGRSVSSAWHASQGKLNYLFVAYCDDETELAEPMDLELYCGVGHGRQPHQLDAADDELERLHLQILIKQEVSPSEEDTAQQGEEKGPQKVVDFKNKVG